MIQPPDGGIMENGVPTMGLMAKASAESSYSVASGRSRQSVVLQTALVFKKIEIEIPGACRSR